MQKRLIGLQGKTPIEFRILARNDENVLFYREVMESVPVELGHQIGCPLPPNMQLVRFERLKAATDVGEQIFELALVDHYAKRVVYYNKVIVLLHDPVLSEKPVTQLLIWRTPDPAYKTVISGIADRVFTDYLLEQYQVIMSDSPTAGQGLLFWERQILVALNHQVFVYYCPPLASKLQLIENLHFFENLQKEIWSSHNNDVQHIIIFSTNVLSSNLILEYLSMPKIS
ncbi:hypothetical protein [Aeromonas caviae]|uniref:hypothetical protein n=1 Tax=Aeromonas caviae TaxID=648 RepID=UPI0038CFE28C